MEKAQTNRAITYLLTAKCQNNKTKIKLIRIVNFHDMQISGMATGRTFLPVPEKPGIRIPVAIPDKYTVCNFE